jgi:hypothetical protein
MRLVATLVIATITLGLSAPARAQYTNSYGYTFNNPVSATANQFFWDSMNRRLLLRSMLKQRGYTDAQLERMSIAEMQASIEGAPAKPAKTYPNATRFKPAKQRLLVGAIVDSMVADKAQRAQLVGAFETAIKMYEAEARKTGFQHDLAGAMAFFIGAAYMVHHDGVEPDEKGLELLAVALRVQMATAEVAKISSADKQKFYELMLVLGTFLIASYQQAANEHDAATVATLRAAAGEALQNFLNLDPAAFTITRNGLELIEK